MVDGGGAHFGSHGAGILLFCKVLHLFPMPGSKVLGLQLCQDFTILEMKVVSVSLPFFRVMTSACLLSSILRDIRAGMVFGNKVCFGLSLAMQMIQKWGL